MTGRLTDRPNGLSRTQIDWGREHGTPFWLYVVEYAGTEQACVVRLENPAETRTVTFDHGWLGIADTDSEQEARED